MEVKREIRWVALGALVLYSSVLAVVLLNPSADLPSTVVRELTRLAAAAGLPAGLAARGRIEFLTNTAMLMPLSALGMVVWPATNWRDWAAYSFVVAAFAETAQAFLPGRSATFVDVVANTLGGALGGLVVSALLRGRAQDRASESPTN